MRIWVSTCGLWDGRLVMEPSGEMGWLVTTYHGTQMLNLWVTLCMAKTRTPLVQQRQRCASVFLGGRLWCSIFPASRVRCSGIFVVRM